mmetsp:Transcript_31319/g.101197  ORF Transcript_31319/g.101197 Transcript_31319/m.101197 type:complete len:220 (-) Transcript_31319:297-956(-)
MRSRLASSSHARPISANSSASSESTDAGGSRPSASQASTIASRFLKMDAVCRSRLPRSLSSSALTSCTRTSNFFFCSLRCCLATLSAFSNSSTRRIISAGAAVGLMRVRAISPSSNERFNRLRRSHSLANSRCCCCCCRPPCSDALPSSRNCFCSARTCCFSRVASFCCTSLGPSCATPCLCRSRSFSSVSFSSSCASSCCCTSATSLRSPFTSSTRFV